MWAKIKAWFKDSETIFYARLQVIGGIIGAALLSDPSILEAIKSVLKPQYVPYFVVASGLLTEYLRRRRSTDL